MKKIFACLFGMLFVVAGAGNAMADIKAATTNTVKRSVYNINYGVATNSSAPNYNYKTGRIPQTNKLTAITGTAPSTTTANVTVGRLASVSTSDGTVTENSATSGTQAPTATIAANTANIAVLERDKLVKPGTGGNCAQGFQCGYVTTGAHANTTANKVWLKVTKCRKKSDTSQDCSASNPGDCECTVNGTNYN